VARFEPLDERTGFSGNGASLNCQAGARVAVLLPVFGRHFPPNRDILKKQSVLMELREAHCQRCSPEKLDAAIKRYWETKDPFVLDPVRDMPRRDVIIRAFFTEKNGA
jgi:hypothetical protein